MKLPSCVKFVLETVLGVYESTGVSKLLPIQIRQIRNIKITSHNMQCGKFYFNIKSLHDIIVYRNSFIWKLRKGNQTI